MFPRTIIVLLILVFVFVYTFFGVRSGAHIDTTGYAIGVAFFGFFVIIGMRIFEAYKLRKQFKSLIIENDYIEYKDNGLVHHIKKQDIEKIEIGLAQDYLTSQSHREFGRRDVADIIVSANDNKYIIRVSAGKINKVRTMFEKYSYPKMEGSVTQFTLLGKGINVLIILYLVFMFLIALGFLMGKLD